MTSEPAPTYTEAQALARIARLRRHGFWPGMVQVGERVRLTSDPDVSGQRHRGLARDTDLAEIGPQGANLICPPSDLAQQGGKSDLPPDRTEGFPQ